MATSVSSLTTTFTPPSSCLSSFFSVVSGFDQLGPSPTALECYPPRWNGDGEPFFSPGICPSGYSSAWSTINSAGTVTETVVNCCPRSYIWNSPARLYDASSRTFCYSLYANAASTVVLTGEIYSGTIDQGSAYTRTLGYDGVACATSVQVRFQATDSSILSHAVTSTVATVTVMSTVTTTAHAVTSTVATVTVMSTVTTTAHAKGLNTSAKSGIGVGVALGVLLMLAVAFGIFFLNKKRKSREQTGGDHSATPVSPMMVVKPELDANRTALTRIEMEAS